MLTESFKYEYGCLMLDLNIPKWNILKENINPNDIYNEEGFGFEKEPHCTILFGFIDSDEVFPKIKTILQKIHKPILLELTKISMFESKDYDVLKFDVDSSVLHKLNKKFRDDFEYKTNYPDYHPHVTISYLKKGTAKKYTTDFDKKYKILATQFSYSRPEGKEKERYNINLKDSTNEGIYSPEGAIYPTVSKYCKDRKNMCLTGDLKTDFVLNKKMKRDTVY